MDRELACADRSPEDTCETALDALLPARSADDVALLVARTRTMDPEQGRPVGPDH